MKIYYKVHKRNLKFVPDITKNQIEIWSMICDESKNNGYIYIAFDHEITPITPYGFMNNIDYSVAYFKIEGYLYMGEIINPRKLKLEKLNEI